jgi:hypothetical protein
MKKVTASKLFGLVAIVTTSIIVTDQCLAFGLGDITKPIMDGASQLDPTRRGSAARDAIENTSNMGRFKFRLNNKCNRVLDVKVEYKLTHINHWSNGNWVFSPYENAYLFDTKNRYVYVSAKARNSNIRWNRKKVDLGRTFNTFTYNLTCR